MRIFLEKIDMSGDLFCLNVNEEYTERCGELFRTNMDNIIIHCTMCEDKFRGFDVFVVHLNKEHVNKFLQPNVENEASQQTFEENFSLFENELFDTDLIDMFDLTFLDNILTSNEHDNFLNKDLEIASKAPTTEETPSDCGSKSEFRAVRPCNIQSHIEERPHKCLVCGLGFKDKYNMQHHIQRHSLERKHECAECEKKFYTGYELKIHLKVHSQERPFACKDCGRGFRTNALLLKHNKRHTNQRDFKCTECSKEFYEKGTLQEHMFIHKRDKHYACNLCDAVFLLRKSLLRHKRAHENRKLLKCELCSAVFVQNRGLQTHMKKRHSEL